jgi:hypothetical protein
LARPRRYPQSAGQRAHGRHQSHSEGQIAGRAIDADRYSFRRCQVADFAEQEVDRLKLALCKIHHRPGSIESEIAAAKAASGLARKSAARRSPPKWRAKD